MRPLADAVPGGVRLTTPIRWRMERRRKRTIAATKAIRTTPPPTVAAAMIAMLFLPDGGGVVSSGGTATPGAGGGGALNSMGTPGGEDLGGGGDCDGGGDGGEISWMLRLTTSILPNPLPAMIVPRRLDPVATGGGGGEQMRMSVPAPQGGPGGDAGGEGPGRRILFTRLDSSRVSTPDVGGMLILVRTMIEPRRISRTSTSISSPRTVRKASVYLAMKSSL